ncbi:hypothetical protein BpHYR1_009089 [Brachionus plicatilis]|uniref:Uncharacterized protein n=1 Tax=Brachionus plicatilis TaxID=10195 RepID=A0A3M7QMQ3_BRAPC|nr:hypothetical protein BpHYR1_009089 [Brachionus plicatilis]
MNTKSKLAVRFLDQPDRTYFYVGPNQIENFLNNSKLADLFADNLKIKTKVDSEANLDAVAERCWTWMMLANERKIKVMNIGTNEHIAKTSQQEQRRHNVVQRAKLVGSERHEEMSTTAFSSIGLPDKIVTIETVDFFKIKNGQHHETTALRAISASNLASRSFTTTITTITINN